MPSYLKNDIILVRYPFSDLSGSKVRPAVVVNTPHVSQDIFIIPLTSKTKSLFAGEFVLSDWVAAGLNVETAVKRGYPPHPVYRSDDSKYSGFAYLWDEFGLFVGWASCPSLVL
jgi:hypothetical protein